MLGDQKFNFSEHGHVAYQIEGKEDTSQGQTGDLGVGLNLKRSNMRFLLELGICDGASLTAHSNFFLIHTLILINSSITGLEKQNFIA